MNLYKNTLLTNPAINIEPGHHKILKNLQANIIRHHKRKYSCYLFLRFIDDMKLRTKMIESENEKFKEDAQRAARVFMNKLAHGIQDEKVNLKLTSAHEQMGLDKAAQDLSKASIAAREIITIALSHAGYKFLELGYMAPKSDAFKRGAQKIQRGFHIDHDQMESYFGETHAMIMIASNNQEDMTNGVRLVESEVDGTPITILHKQYGQLITEEIEGKKKRTIYKDHFGYVDGISQPLFFPKGKQDSLNVKDIASLDTVLINDYGSGDPKFNYGSFLTILKLQQNEDAFNQLVKDLRDQSPKDKNDNPVISDDEDAKAFIMGRYPKGASILNKSKKDEYHFDNNFNYNELVFDGEKWQKDKNGVGCPLFSHVRKTNSRDDASGYSKSKIARRGVPYSDGDKQKGILFQSFQSNIKNQFEDLIVKKLHNPTHNGVTGGIDILTGKAESIRILNGKNKKILKISLPLVTYLGGVYLFTPSISFFKNILKFHPHIEIGKTAKANIGGEDDTPRDANIPQGFIDDLGNLKMPAKIKLGDYRDEIIAELVSRISEPAIKQTPLDQMGYLDNED